MNAVVSYVAPSPGDGGDIVATISGGGPGCSFASAGYTDVLPAPPPTGVSFPHGLFGFSLQGCTSSPVSFTIVYPTALPAGSQYWKYGPTPDNGADHWYVLTAADNDIQIAGDTVSFTIADGGRGDDDLTVNGAIVDAGGPGVSAQAEPVQPVPGLSQWAMLLLSALMILTVSGGAMRPRRQAGR